MRTGRARRALVCFFRVSEAARGETLLTLRGAFVVSIVTALLFRKMQSVWPGVMVHAVNNATAMTVPLLLSAVSG
ncbi:type II CAAX prenyl endopeptidase Rce1 family protein [Mycetocola zhujimingii]|uniref:CPBP family glutamic-type intramembrane protease n=1 Tax=Mycetocola zhujimingii TaxID=2079792 RepID=UPI000D34B573|nr:CPBP family glutamic-type intramembrane protease [Mycetocola zhujimingii]AWB86796.1 hypothetical protein C3E77_09305 [Mycetocola zhujimingii]